MVIDEFDVQGVDLTNTLDNVLVLATYSTIKHLFSQKVLEIVVMTFAKQLKESEDQNQISQTCIVLDQVVSILLFGIPFILWLDRFD